MATSVERTGKENWREVVPHREEVLLEDFEIFKDYLVLEERKHGLTHIRIIPWAGGDEHTIEIDEPAYRVETDRNPEFDTPLLRFNYTSMTTPLSVYDYDMVTRKKVLLKQEEVLGDFQPKNYVTERLFALSRDGTEIPISLVYRKGLKMDGQNPLLLYGYGSYGISIDATFSSPRLSLIDRGFIFAIAHIRGGQELGRQWYEDGKLLKKKNTFTDFIVCGEYLIREQYTNKDKMFAMGRSAGGLLMGAVSNMRPDLFKGIIAGVPFVDVITTMLDPSIPLTTGEYDEWGDPNKKEYYDYILSYSPYDNIEAKDYPHILVITSLHDSQDMGITLKEPLSSSTVGKKYMSIMSIITGISFISALMTRQKISASWQPLSKERKRRTGGKSSPTGRKFSLRILKSLRITWFSKSASMA